MVRWLSTVSAEFADWPHSTVTTTTAPESRQWWRWLNTTWLRKLQFPRIPVLSVVNSRAVANLALLWLLFCNWEIQRKSSPAAIRPSDRKLGKWLVLFIGDMHLYSCDWRWLWIDTFLDDRSTVYYHWISIYNHAALPSFTLRWICILMDHNLRGLIREIISLFIHGPFNFAQPIIRLVRRRFVCIHELFTKF